MPESQENKARELLDVDPEEVSLVDLGANKRKFLVIKQDPTRNQRSKTSVDKGTEEMENAESTENEESTTEEPTTEEPAVEEPAVEEPETTEEPAATEESAVEEPVAKATLTQEQSGFITTAVDALKSFGASFAPAPEKVEKGDNTALASTLKQQISKGFEDLQKKQEGSMEKINKRLDKLEGARPSAESEDVETPANVTKAKKSDEELFGGLFGR